MTEHKILGLIESMAQNGQVMTEQKYKEIADLLGKKVNDRKPIYRISFIRTDSTIERLDDEVLLLRNKPHLQQQLIELTKGEHESIENHIENDGYHIADHCILQSRSACAIDIEFGSTEDAPGIVRVINPEIVIVRIVPV